MLHRILIAVVLAVVSILSEGQVEAQQRGPTTPPLPLGELRPALLPTLVGPGENSDAVAVGATRYASGARPVVVSPVEASQRPSSAAERARVGFLIGALVAGGATLMLCARTDDCPTRSMTAAAAGIGGLVGAGFGVLADPERRRRDE